MFVLFTPYTYLFLIVYAVVMCCLFTLSNFYVFWLYIEFLTLLFIGVSFTLFVNSYAQLIIYFLLQTVASFNLLVFYILGMQYLFLASLLLNLAMFPFFFWYINVLYRFPNFLFFFVSTFHNLPPLLIFYQFYDYSSIYFLMLSSVMTLFISGLYMLVISDLRYLLIVSSMANNSWLVLSLITSDFWVFLSFFILYSVTLYSLILILGSSSKFISYSSVGHGSRLLLGFLLLINIAGFPPMPIFLTNFFIVYNLLVEWDFEILFFIALILVSNVILMVSYVQCYSNYLVNTYSSVNSLFLN